MTTCFWFASSCISLRVACHSVTTHRLLCRNSYTSVPWKETCVICTLSTQDTQRTAITLSLLLLLLLVMCCCYSTLQTSPIARLSVNCTLTYAAWVWSRASLYFPFIDSTSSPMFTADCDIVISTALIIIVADCMPNAITMLMLMYSVTSYRTVYEHYNTLLYCTEFR